jgi:hypothetical protein
MPPHFLEGESGAGRRVFYLKFTGCTEHLYVPEYNWRAFGSYHSFANAPCPLNSPYAPPGIDLPDAIESTVARAGGQTLPFYSPLTLAKAIESIKQADGR